MEYKCTIGLDNSGIPYIVINGFNGVKDAINMERGFYQPALESWDHTFITCGVLKGIGSAKKKVPKWFNHLKEYRLLPSENGYLRTDSRTVEIEGDGIVMAIY